MKVYIKPLIISFLFLSYSNAEIIQLNDRFVFIRTDSKNVMVGLDKPWIDDDAKKLYTLCSVDVTENGLSFTFYTRRALPLKFCTNLRSMVKKLKKKNAKLEILGNSPLTDKDKNQIAASFEMIRGKTGYTGYFGEDYSNLPKLYVDWEQWMKNPIDKKFLP
jgi:hypothetical protein